MSDDQFAPPPPPDNPGGTPPPPPPPPPPSGGDPTGGFADPGMPPGASAPAAPSAAPYGGGQAPAPMPGPAATPPSSGGGRKTILIVIVAIILLCCCITLGTGAWLFQSGNVSDVFRVFGGEEPEPVATSDAGPIGDSGQVTVWLTWDEPVDMELQIWDETGEENLGSSWYYNGVDVTDGGEEYFEFMDYDGEDYSSGTYVVSAYYLGSSASDYPEANVTLTVQDIDGNIQTFDKAIKYDPGYDQWHAVRIDASTGSATLLDEWY